MPTISWQRVAGGIALLGIAAAASPAAATGAYSTFECERVWGAAKGNNSIQSCIVNATQLASLFTTGKARAEVGGSLIPIAIALIIAISFPIFLALRYCADFCGSSTRRPGHFCYGGEEWDGASADTKNRAYDAADASRTRSLAYVSLVVGFVPMVLLLIGTGDIQEGYNTIFGEIFAIAGWAEQREQALRNLVFYGPIIPPLNATFLTNMRNAISNYKSGIQNANDVNRKLIDIIKSVSIVFSVVPGLSLLANAIFAAYDIRRIYPLLNSLAHFALLVLYAFIASAVLLLGIVTGRICGERDAFLAGQPSIASHYLVPVCEESGSFAPVRLALAQAAATTSVTACSKLATHCDSASPAYNASAPMKRWYCPALTNPAAQCQNETAVSNMFHGQNMVPLTGAPFSCNPSGPNPCNLRECQANCTVQADRDVANNVLVEEIKAMRIASAQRIFNLELGNCTALVRQAATYFASCGVIRTSVFYVGIGSCIFTGLFVIGMVVIFRGQKRFFKPIHVPKEASPTISTEPVPSF